MTENEAMGEIRSVLAHKYVDWEALRSLLEYIQNPGLADSVARQIREADARLPFVMPGTQYDRQYCVVTWANNKINPDEKINFWSKS